VPFPTPPIKNMTDFVVFCFVSIVAIILVGAVIGLFVDAVMDPDGDRSSLLNALSDITTTLIGALIGFIAGKGTGHAEAQEEQQKRTAEEEKKRVDDSP
jgi:uncharacterized membrane protein YeaQ/YmgE (transglycosylase-associated protein family)